MKKQMTSKERIIAAIEHKSVDRLPMDYWGTPEMTKKILKELCVSTQMEAWDKLGIDKIVNIQPKFICNSELDKDTVMDTWFVKEGKEIVTDYWGVKNKIVEYGCGLGAYYEAFSHPLEKYESIDEIEQNYIWPKADWFDFSTILKQCKMYPDHAVESGYFAPFYYFNQIRGIELSLMDMAADEEIAFYLLDNICKFLLDYHERLFDAANGNLSITHMTDDFGTQTGLMISLEMFDKYFKKYYEKFIKLAKNYGIKVFHHDDGAIMPLIPRLVDLGIDVLNPIQWHLPGMNLIQLKKDFGDRLCFHGGVDNQYVLPFGTVKDVKKEVETCLEILGGDRTGYIFAPCHNIQPNTPFENVVALYETAKQYMSEWK